MPKFYVTQGTTLRHDGETYHEGDEVEMEARQAAPKLQGPTPSLSKTNWKKKAAPKKTASKKGGDEGDGDSGDAGDGGSES